MRFMFLVFLVVTLSPLWVPLFLLMAAGLIAFGFSVLVFQGDLRIGN